MYIYISRSLFPYLYLHLAHTLSTGLRQGVFVWAVGMGRGRRVYGGVREEWVAGWIEGGAAGRVSELWKVYWACTRLNLEP